MRSIAKGKILEDLRKDLWNDSKERNERLRLLLKERYSNTTECKFPEQVDMNRHIYIPVEFPRLLGLTKSAVAVYPVLCSKANFEEDKPFHISREDIARIAGIAPLTVDKGIRSLMQCQFSFESPVLKRELFTTGKKHYYMYKVFFFRKSFLEDFKGEYFIFHTCILMSQVWAGLSPRAKALYMVMRSMARFDYAAYIYDKDPEENVFDGDEMRYAYGEGYKDREWDLCSVSLAELCRTISINASNMVGVIKELESCRLVEVIDDGQFKVYLKPVWRTIKSAAYPPDL